MGLFKRISDIISANLNEMTEGFEDPEKMLKQAIREMEQTIADATQETAKVLANENLLAKELANNQRQTDDWQRKAELAVSRSRDDLVAAVLTSEVSSGVGHTTQICVLPGYQGNGIGRMLMQSSAEALRAMKFRELTLTVTSANAAAVKLYEKLGFTTIRTFTAGVWPR